MKPGELTFQNNAFWRYTELLDRIGKLQERSTKEDLKLNNACVNSQRLSDIASQAGETSIAANFHARTLWHSLYDRVRGR
jgi:hypothetical protein